MKNINIQNYEYEIDGETKTITNEMYDEIYHLVHKLMSIYQIKKPSPDNIVSAIINYYHTPDELCDILEEDLESFEEVYILIKNNISSFKTQDNKYLIDRFILFYDPNNIRENQRMTKSLSFKILYMMWMIFYSIVAFIIRLFRGDCHK